MKTLAALTLVAALALAGCGVSEKSLAGKWTGKLVMSEEDKKSGGQFAEAMANSMTFDLELKEDKTFTLAAMGMPSEGTWTLADGKVTLTMTKAMGVAVTPSSSQKPLVMSVGDGGEKLTMTDPEKPDASTVEFTKVESE